MDDRIMNKPQLATVLCGGLGTRMHPYTKTRPKPMILCDEKPFLFHLLSQIAELGIRRFLLLIGYLGEQIEEYFGDGREWGWEIHYSKGPVAWNTGKRIWEARNDLDERFLLLYSDNFSPYPLEKAFALHEENAPALTLMISPKSPGNIAIDESKMVRHYDNHRSKELGFVEIGYMIAEKKRMLDFFDDVDCSLSNILQSMAKQGEICAFEQKDRYHSISDPSRWKKAEKYLTPKKILLLDRDGVINRKAPRGEYISSWEQFKWIPENKVAIKMLAEEGFEFIIISNQAGIARGMIKKEELDRIHLNMKADFAKDGVRILEVYICPHHWDEDCTCRKPNPGMLLQASQEYFFRLDRTLFIGDDVRDCQAAWNAGCDSIFIGEANELVNLPDNQRPICSVASLWDSLSQIRERFPSP